MVLCHKRLKPSTTLRLLVFQSLLQLTRLINQVLTQNVLSVNWLSMESFQQHGVAIVNSLKSQLNLDKTLKNCLKPFFLWLKWKSLKRIQVFVPSVPLLKLVWIKVKVRSQPSLFNKVPCMFKTQSLLVIPSDVSVL